VTHRDLKPYNVRLGPRAQATLVSLGVATMVGAYPNAFVDWDAFALLQPRLPPQYWRNQARCEWPLFACAAVAGAGADTLREIRQAAWREAWRRFGA